MRKFLSKVSVLNFKKTDFRLRHF